MLLTGSNLRTTRHSGGFGLTVPSAFRSYKGGAHDGLATQSSGSVDVVGSFWGDIRGHRRDLLAGENPGRGRANRSVQECLAWSFAPAWHHLRAVCGIVAAQVWNDVDRAKVAVNSEASA